MRFKMDRVGLNIAHARKLDRETPVIDFLEFGSNSYLWIGGENGPCYATCDKKAQLIRLAKLILKTYGVKA